MVIKKIDKTWWIRIGQLAMVAVIVICGIISMQPVKDEKNTTVTLDQGRLKYTGDLVERRFSGQGILTFQDGSVYTGSFKDGYFNGKGDFKAKDGWHYVGDFKKGKAEGQGTLTLEMGLIYKGKFEDGEYQGK